MLAVSCGNSSIQLVDQSGNLTNIKPAELAGVGIPNVGKTFEVIHTDFAEWKLANSATSNAYAKGLGYHSRFTAHQVYEFKTAARCYLVPALVLMRALFRPSSVTLKAAFFPQGLDRITVPLFDQNKQLSRCVLDPAIYHDRNRQDSFEAALHWMYCRPSARKMFNSVYWYYRAGTIGIDLPIGKSTLTGKSVRHGDYWLVTHLSIVRIDSDEGAIAEFMGPQKSTIHLYKWSRAHKQTDAPIPIAPQGRIALNDEEWSGITNYFNTCHKITKHSKRLLIDGILSKLASNKPWRNCHYPTGTWVNASNLYQVLRKNGTWPHIIEVLEKMRAPKH